MGQGMVADGSVGAGSRVIALPSFVDVTWLYFFFYWLQFHIREEL